MNLHTAEEINPTLFDDSPTSINNDETSLTRIFHHSRDEKAAKGDRVRQTQDFDQGCMSPYSPDQNSSLTPQPSAFPAFAVERDEISGLTPDNDQEKDLSEKENRYVVVSQKKFSPLLMLFPISKGEKKDIKEQPLQDRNRAEQQRRIDDSSNSSAVIVRSPYPATITEKRNSSSSQLTSVESTSLLFKTLIYCPGCRQWHSAANISKQQLPQILFIKNQETNFWHPVCRQDEQPTTSLFQRTLLLFTTQSLLRVSIEKISFQLLIDRYGEEVLYHSNPTTGELQKSSFQDPINTLPVLSHWAFILLQSRSFMPNPLIHSLLISSLTEAQNALKTTPPVEQNEKTPLLKKESVPTTYSSTFVEK